MPSTGVSPDAAGTAAGAGGGLAAAAGTGPLAVRGLREGHGDPVVFLHGFGSDISSWRAFVGGVASPNPLTALDLPGHGASAGVAVDGFDALVDTVAASLEAAGATRIHLVGHSLGAAVATALAGGGTLDVRSLTLLAPAGLGPAIDGAFVEGFCAAEGEAALAAWMTCLVHDPAALTPTLVRATARAREAEGVAAAQARLARALFPSGTQVFGVRPALERYTGPVRAVIGLQDAVIPAAQAGGLPGHVAVHRLAGVGHLPQLEAAPLVGRLVAQTVASAG
ncbi:MAG: alpha/beta fold hydrolase [Azospirillaceae bacterium]